MANLAGNGNIAISKNSPLPRIEDKLFFNPALFKNKQSANSARGCVWDKPTQGQSVDPLLASNLEPELG